MEFECKRCGACCKLAGNTMKYLPLQFAAIFNPDETGKCQHLIKDDSGQYACDIHDMRPLICNVAWSIKNRSATLGLSEEAMVELTKNACEVLNNEYVPITS